MDRDRPGPSNAPSTSATPEITTQSLTGMRPASSLSEWQLQCVLFRSNLTQYYDVFISCGGDDVDQLMEFSKDRELYLREAITHVGAPPLPAILNTQVNTSLTLQALFSQQIQTPFSRSQLQPIDSPSTSSTTFRLPFPTNPAQPSFSAHQLNISGLQSAEFLALISGAAISSSQPAPLSLPTLTQTMRGSPSTSSTVQQTLSQSEIDKLQSTTETVLRLQPDVEAKTGNRKPTKEVQQILQLPINHPDRLTKFRQCSAIYGRPDATRRKPQKILTHHELLINEAAAQICLQQPDYLTRRSDLFTLARQISRQSGLQQHRVRDMDAGHLAGESISPSIRSTPTPDEAISRSHSVSVEPIEEQSESNVPLKRKRPHSPPSKIDPKKPPPK